MKQLYLVCTRSAVTASALTYIINTSPDFYNMAHNNLWLKEHSEWFGDAHIIDDWWNVHDDIAKAYDPDFRNNIELSEEKLIAVYNAWQEFPSDSHICLFTHARNTKDIMAYAKKNNLPVKVITTIMGNNSHHFIEAFLRREYNEEMNTYENSAEVWKYIYHQLAKQDEVWQESYDYCFQMSDWLHTPELLYSTLGVQASVDIHIWVSQYLKWNGCHDLVEPDNSWRDDDVIGRMKFLTWAYNNNTSDKQFGSEKIKFAILLESLYNKNYTNDPAILISDAKETLGIDLTDHV